MVKLVLVFLLGSLWISCGNAPETVQNKTTSSKDKIENTQTVSIDDTLPTDTEKTVVSPSTEELEVEQISKSSEIPVQNKMKKEEEKSSKSPEGMLVKEKMEEKVVAPISETAEQEMEKTATLSEVEVVEEEETVEPMEKVEEKKKVAAKPDHSSWNSLLAKYVTTKGDVKYKAFKSDVSALDDYLNHLAENSPKKDWSKNEKLAYYINLYNAATVKLIVDNYPTKSIKDIQNPWGKDWVKTGDGLLSLGDIEHKILRKMNEPRIHFAINCASFSCPKLVNKAFTASQMEAQLEAATLDFINDTTRNIISAEKMELSNIFKWYKKDFTDNGSLTEYIKPYTKVVINTDTKIGYLKYDWKLNEAK